MHYTVHIMQYTVCSTQYAQYTAAEYSMQHTEHSMQFVVCSIQYAHSM